MGALSGITPSDRWIEESHLIALQITSSSISTPPSFSAAQNVLITNAVNLETNSQSTVILFTKSIPTLAPGQTL